jgi:hypothetical protein
MREPSQNKPNALTDLQPDDIQAVHRDFRNELGVLQLSVLDLLEQLAVLFKFSLGRFAKSFLARNS